MARPTKLDDAVAGRVLQALRAGNYLDTAAAFAGVHRSTLHDWLKKGRAENAREPYASFVDDVDEAMGDAEAMFVARIAKAAEDARNWTAAAWWLERRFPDRWGRRDRLEHTGAGGGPIEVQSPAAKIADRLDDLEERRRRRQAG